MLKNSFISSRGSRITKARAVVLEALEKYNKADTVYHGNCLISVVIDTRKELENQ